MKFIPLEYQILRGLPSTSRYPAPVQPDDVPGYVITLLAGAEKRLNDEAGHCVVKHKEGVFFEDRDHDWMFRGGKFFFYSRTISPAIENPETPETVDVMLVYKWMTLDMSIDGVEDGRSTIKGVRHGVPMSIDITNTNHKRNAPAKWEAVFSMPSLGSVPVDQVEAIARAQIRLAELADREIARRVQLENPDNELESALPAHQPG